MKTLAHYIALVLFVLISTLSAASAQDLSLLPKYGNAPKSELQRSADEQFLAGMDAHYAGDRSKAGEDAVSRGWQAFRRKNAQEAMRRFNQAWLLDPKNGSALWGMGAIQGSSGKSNEALALYEEAAQYLGDDIDFSVDFARTQAMVATQTSNDALLRQALKRFAGNHQRAPQNTLNLQNWALTLFYLDDYAGAWEKIRLAEATPRGSDVDPNFMADSQAKMPRAGKPPQLWSNHKRLNVAPDVCAAMAQETLVALGYTGIVSNGYSSYGNREENRAAIKCVEIPQGSFVYFAVAGASKERVEKLRNEIGWKF